MRRDSVLLQLLALLVVAFAGRVDAGSKPTSADAAFGVTSVSAERNGASIKRLLRGEGTSTESLAANTTTKPDDEEERSPVGDAARFATNAFKAKAKNTIMLWRGHAPEKALKKLAVTSLNDKNFNKFARYYAEYLVKHPAKAASLPATAEDVVLLPKLTEWLRQRLRPSQVKQLLKDAGSTNVEKYLQLYRKDADDALALPMFSKWVQQKRPPSQVNILLKDLEISDISKYMGKYMEAGAAKNAFQKWVSKKLLPKEVAQKLKSAEVPDVSKYVGQYMEAGGANVAIRTWLDEKILPQHLAQKLKNAGVPDASKYMGRYMEAGGATLALEWYINLPRALFPQEVMFRLQAAQVPDIKKYVGQYVSMWGKKQAELSRKIS